MNPVDAHPDYAKIYGIACSLFRKTDYFNHGPYDETYYTLRVYETAKEIIALLRKPVAVQQVLVACILHDVGKSRLDLKKLNAAKDVHDIEWHRHPRLGVPIARRILKRLGHSGPFITAVCHLIAHHDTRLPVMSKSIELQILQDADLLADAGLAGFARPFLYAGRHRRDTISTIKYLQQAVDRVEQDGMLNLPVSKMIAKKKMRLYRRLVDALSDEVRSDLLDGRR